MGLGREHVVGDFELMENVGQEEENQMNVGVASRHQQQELPLPPPNAASQDDKEVHE